jgi:hypothetical protein
MAAIGEATTETADDIEDTERVQRIGNVMGPDPRAVAVIYEEGAVLGAIPGATMGKSSDTTATLSREGIQKEDTTR